MASFCTGFSHFRRKLDTGGRSVWGNLTQKVADFASMPQKHLGVLSSNPISLCETLCPKTRSILQVAYGLDLLLRVSSTVVLAGKTLRRICRARVKNRTQFISAIVMKEK